MKLEFYIAIFFIILSNILFFFMFGSIPEVPEWAEYILVVFYNIACGMVILSYLIQGNESHILKGRK